MKRKIQILALMLVGIMLSSNLAWADYSVSLNGENTGLSNTDAFSSTTQNGVTVSADKNGGTQTAYYTSGDAVRFYAKNKMTVSFGSAMTQIVINYGSKSNAITSASVGSIGTYNGTAKTQTWTGSATSVTFTFGGTKGNDQITSVVVTAGGSKYTLHYDVQGHGTAPADQTNISTGGKATEPTAPTCTGYTFGGWFENSECSGSQWNFSTGTISANKTLYAKWTAKTYTITLDANGHGAANGSATATYDATTLSSVSGVTANTGYVLNGYFTATSGGTKVINANGTLVSNVSGYTDATGKWNKDAACTLHAQYTQQFTITFIDKLQGRDGYAGPTGHTLQVADGATFTFPDALTDGTPTAEQKTSGTCEQQHYHFVGWILSTEESTANNDGHANVKEAGSTSSAVSAAATYYAVWAKEE